MSKSLASKNSDGDIVSIPFSLFTTSRFMALERLFFDPIERDKSQFGDRGKTTFQSRVCAQTDSMDLEYLDYLFQHALVHDE